MSGRKTRGRKLEDRLKDIQHEILVAVASGKPVVEVITLVCQRVEDVAPNAMCSVSSHSSSSPRLTHTPVP